MAEKVWKENHEHWHWRSNQRSEAKGADSNTSAKILPVNPDVQQMTCSLQNREKRENLSLHMLRSIDRQRPQRCKKYREGRVDDSERTTYGGFDA